MARPKGCPNPNAGAKPMFETAEQMQALIDKFWAYIDENKVPATIERLACFLDCDRDTVLNYSKKDIFFGTLKKARDLILANKVERLNTSGTPTAGIIFDLKNNYQYKDKTEQEVTGKDGTPFIVNINRTSAD